MNTILDVWSRVAPVYGGVGPSAARLAAEVARTTGWDSRLVAICDPGETQLADGIPLHVGRLHPSPWRPMSDFQIRQNLDDSLTDCSVCHVHGLWLPHTLAFRRGAHKRKKMLVSSAHGMLEKWELANKGLKKRVYSRLFERSSLAQSDCLRALTLREVEDYRAYGLRNPIALIPNGISPLPWTDPEIIYSTFGELRNKRIVLFLGRLHAKKGIFDLINAWRTVAQIDPDVHLLIAGGDTDGTSLIARSMVASLGLNKSITFAGTLTGESKRSALCAARYFCLPSYSEGLSVALLESLSIGLPVIATQACNLDEIVSAGAGFITGNDPRTLAGVLTRALAADETSWQTMRAGALRLAREHFNWESIGASAGALYNWLLGGPRPDCIVT